MSNNDIKYLKDNGGMFRRYSESPVLSETAKYIQDKSEDQQKSDSFSWAAYYKDGATDEEHLKSERMRVLARDIPKMCCLKCMGKKNSLIIYVHGCIHPMSGDAYYDVELFCNKCKVYSAFSYAEN